MLGEIKIVVGSCEVTAKPVSRWRRLLCGLLPFIQGAKTKFEITFTAQANTVNDTLYIYSIQDSAGHRNPPQTISLPPMRQDDKLIRTTIDMPLYYSGDSFLTINQLSTGAEYSIYIFHSTSRNTIFFSVVALITAIVIAILTLTLRN